MPKFLLKKTTLHPLPIEALRQLIGYALLHDEKIDQFRFDALGIYFSRSGSFRYLSTQKIIQECLPSFGKVDEARRAFIHEMRLA